MSFGGHDDQFAGLDRPTGLIFHNDVLYVGDSSRKHPAIYKFDRDGNVLGSISDDRLADIESISPFEDGSFLVTTRSLILSLEPQNQVFNLVYTETEKTQTRFTAAGVDPNGNIIASDFDSERLAWFSRIAGIYSGLHVEISRVVPDRFPEVWVECQVLDNLGNPVVGLDQSNFTVTEGRKALPDAKLQAMGYRETNFSSAILVQSDETMASDYNREAVVNAVGGIYDSLGGASKFCLVSSGQTAAVEAASGSSRQLLQASVQNIPHPPFWYLDLGIRTAVPQLMKNAGLRELIFVGQGNLPEDAFARYGLEENLNYLRNNRVKFSVIQVADLALDPALARLVSETGGSIRLLYNPKGLADLGGELITRKDGSYLFRFNSLFDSDFGRKYLPVEIEARLFQKSGRDESGYFAPLRL